jgi:hypothetical protein
MSNDMSNHNEKKYDGVANFNGPEVLSATDHRTVEAMLVKEMNRLSVKERELIQEEIHGAKSMAQEESPPMVQYNLKAMQDAIDVIPIKNAYDQALVLYSKQQQKQHLSFVYRNVYQVCYVYDLNLRIRFLRHEFWNPVLAARRFIKYLDLLLEYFGPEALMRPVRIAILNGCDRIRKRCAVLMNSFNFFTPVEILGSLRRKPANHAKRELASASIKR